VAKECDASDLCVQSVTVTATKKVVQTTDDGLDAVVTSAGKGTFLIRRRKGGPCPLLCYEVRRIHTGGQSGGDGVARQPADVTMSACAFRNPPSGCDRDERGTP
jgi:hypothetical protein